MLGDDRVQVIGLERWAPRDHLEEDPAEGIEIGTAVHLVALPLLRRHVEGCADHGVGLGEHQGDVEELRDPEVDELDLVVRHQEQVVRLEIAVDDAAIVRRRQDVADAGGDRHCTRRRQRPLLGHDRPERAPLHELHDQIGAAVGERAEVEDLDDPRMADRGGRPRLSLEASHQLGILRVALAQDLDGDGTVERPLAAAVDVAHGARAQGRTHLVAVVEHGADERIHLLRRFHHL